MERRVEWCRERARRVDIWSSVLKRRGTRYADCTVANFRVYDDRQTEVGQAVRRYLRELDENIAAGVNVLLFGPAGTGKDHLLAAMMRAAVWKYGYRVEWRNGIDLYGDVRDRMGTDETESGLIRSLVKPDILAISDPVPPIGKLTEFQIQTLFRIVDGRYSNTRPTWVTLNVDRKAEAIERMGAQIVDRLSHDALVRFCDWSSYRQKKGET